jgi:hypothetical protein
MRVGIKQLRCVVNIYGSVIRKPPIQPIYANTN